MDRTLRWALGVLASLAVTPLPLVADVHPQSDARVPDRTAVTVRDSMPDGLQPLAASKGAPNIVVILLDNVGFAASSAFGGPIQTPELDALASQGLKYNRFHVTALCSPTRAALLSGRIAHQVGFGTVVNRSNTDPGYDGLWKKNAVTIAEVLRRNGYSTAAFGKWHLTHPREISPIGPFDRWPTGLGFDFFYGVIDQAGSHWEPLTLYRNTTPVEPPDALRDQYYLTSDLADEAIRWVQTHQALASDRPYFLYFAANGTHIPHHVPKDWVTEYRGRFAIGWDSLRKEIFARQKRLGIVPASSELTTRPLKVPAWDTLSAKQRAIAARQMEVYAAYLAHTDHEVGRLLKAVQSLPRGENTLILYIVGDNGPQGYNIGTEADQSTLKEGPYVDYLYKQLDTLGGPQSFPLISPGWAWMMSTPFDIGMSNEGTVDASRLGSTRTALIVSWPRRIRGRGGLRSQFTDVTDIAPTVYEAAGISLPAAIDGVTQLPMAGTSIAYSFDDPALPSRHRMQIFETGGNRAIYQDGWMAVARHRLSSTNFSQDPWELFHLDQDFSQAHDLSLRYPGKLKELQELFEEEACRNHILPLRVSALNKNRFASAKEFVYQAGFARIPAAHAPQFETSSHSITAEVQIPEHGTQGAVVSYGSGLSGFVLYIKNDRLVYESAVSQRLGYPQERYEISSSTRLPRGQVTLMLEFTKQQEEAQASGLHIGGSRGVARLSVNGRAVSEWTRVRVGSAMYVAPFGIGQAYSSLSQEFQIPFKFTGTLGKVTVRLY